MDERRQTIRVPLVVKVSLTRTDESHYYFSKDISVGGMFIETKEPFSIGEELAMEFSVPLEDTQHKIGVTGEVVRVVTYEDALASQQAAGMGIRFIAVDTGVNSTIENFIREMLVLRGGE